MFSLFIDLIKTYKRKPVHIDNNIFMLHYRATVTMLVSFTIILSAKQLVGDPITCLPSGYSSNSISKEVIDHFCWVTATFTIPTDKNGRTGLDQVATGVHNHEYSDGSEKYHNYYQWVCFIFFSQAVLFYLPRIFWQLAEGGLMRMMSTSINIAQRQGENSNAVTNNNEPAPEPIKVKNYFLRGYHQRYVVNFMICETLNLVNVVGQILLVDHFVEGEFRRYGWKLLEEIQRDFKDRTDPITNVFPIISKCTFYMFGNSGSVQKIDSLCVLPLNVVNEKFFIILWLWLLLLAVLTGLTVLHRFFVVCSKSLRYCMLRARVPAHSGCLVKRLSFELDLGDWFVLYQLSKNVYVGLLHDLMVSLTEKLDEKQSLTYSPSLGGQVQIV